MSVLRAARSVRAAEVYTDLAGSPAVVSIVLGKGIRKELIAHLVIVGKFLAHTVSLIGVMDWGLFGAYTALVNQAPAGLGASRFDPG